MGTRLTPRAAVAIALVVLGSASSSAFAAFSWSNPSGSNAVFDWANGQNQTNLFGSPLVSTAGFVFFPNNLVANSVNGTPASATDTAKVDIFIKAGLQLDKVEVRAYGDYSITGPGPNQVNASTTVSVSNLEQPALPALTSGMITTPGMPITSGAGSWSGVSVTTLPDGVTKVHLNVNALYQATSSSTGAATIGQHIGQAAIEVELFVPEPGSAAVVLGGAGLLLARRRRHHA